MAAGGAFMQNIGPLPAAPQLPVTNREHYAEIRPTDNHAQIVRKIAKNRGVSRRKRAANRAKNHRRFALLKNPLTGTRPAGCPNTYNTVIAFTRAQWYNIAIPMGYPEWLGGNGQPAATLGRMRNEWCCDHGVDILRPADIRAI
ncbi:hypothetical protein BJ508DRAFT_336810 [Ascobolus immersus RN42]|uniref:Uncharacterized protein n=1 Tax=Ascobolus immersus RN42 TaxID=1160509 RepID=A0A3N4HF37_ASCIM|nr:hypothetical protein BJ508DRAFT_336810 [Ascobolus immersus RN42]